MNSIFTVSYGNTMPPPSARSSTPAFSSAVKSPCTALTSRPTRRAASRIDTGPAPQSALSNSQRLAVRTFQSNSGVAKLIRADFSDLPVFQIRTKSAIESEGVRTSRITDFMVPPRNIMWEVGDQLRLRRECVGTLLAAEMTVFAFAVLVVVAQYARPANYI